MSKDRIRRYSDAAPQEMQAKLRRIAARNGDYFQTRELDVAVSGEASAVRRWADARKSAETGLWNVRQFQKKTDYLKRTQDGELKSGGVLTQAVVLKDACFFDALYACAQIEAADMRDTDPAQAAAARQALGVRHYHAFAEAEGIVFDARDNMPVPVVNGEIFSEDCVLDESALEVASRAQGNLAAENALVPVVPKQDILAAVVNLPAQNISADAVINGFAQAARAEKAAGRREKNIIEMKHAFRDVTKTGYKGVTLYTRTQHKDIGSTVVASKVLATITAGITTGLIYGPAASPATLYDFLKFMTGAGGIVAGIATVVTVGTVASYCGDNNENFFSLYRNNGFMMPRRRFEQNIANSRRIARSLPTDEMRAAGEQILEQVDLGFRTMTARAAFQKAATNHGLTAPLSRFAMKREIGRLVKTAKKVGMEEGEMNHLLAVLQARPESQEFNGQLELAINNQLDNFAKLVAQAKGHSKGYLPKPGAA